MSEPVIENLVFEGCGVIGAAYVGALEVLEEHDLLKGVRRVAGTSAGAITGSLVAVGVTNEVLRDQLASTALGNFLDGGSIFGRMQRITERYGLYAGEAFEQWIAERIGQATERAVGENRPNLTFGSLRVLATQLPETFRDLYVVATNLTQQRAQVFSADTTPTLPIRRAVRMSLSVPGIYEVVEHDGDLYVDGGLAWNYPFEIFGGALRLPVSGHPSRFRHVNAPERTLGFVIGSRGERAHEDGAWTSSPIEIRSLQGFLQALFSLSVKVSTASQLDDEVIRRTVFIDGTDGVSPVDFSLTPETIASLVLAGRRATETWLSEPKPSPTPEA